MSKFEVGDWVIAPRLWEGELRIARITPNLLYTIDVETNEEEWCFTSEGKHFDTDLQPSLFHAGTKITIEESQPKRWPWVNVYQNYTTEYIFAGDSYKTKEEAIEKKGASYYLHTCQLKPEE